MYEPKNGKGEARVLTLKGISICEYKGPGLLGPTREKLRESRFDYEQINKLLDKASPVKPSTVQRTTKLVLLRGNRYVFKRLYWAFFRSS